MKEPSKKSTKKVSQGLDKDKSLIKNIKSSKTKNQKIKIEKTKLRNIDSKIKAKKRQKIQEKKKKTQLKRKASEKKIHKKKNNQKNNIKNSKKDKTKCPPNMAPLKTKDGLLCVGKCPHSGGPIYYNPSIDKLVCKWHGSQFKTSGKVLTPPAIENLKIKKIK